MKSGKSPGWRQTLEEKSGKLGSLSNSEQLCSSQDGDGRRLLKHTLEADNPPEGNVNNIEGLEGSPSGRNCSERCNSVANYTRKPGYYGRVQIPFLKNLVKTIGYF
jgi:hypothetical protein